MSDKLDQLREEGLKYEGFREGYQARDGHVRLGIILLVIIGLVGIALPFLLTLIRSSIE